MPTKKPHINELNLLRALAALSVIIIHITADPLAFNPPGTLSWTLAAAANQFGRFSIAIFVFITGVALFYNYDNLTDFHYGQFLKKRCIYILTPYLIWSVFYFTLRTLISHSHQTPVALVRTLLIQLAEGTAFYHLYFIILIFQFYLLFPAFLWLMQLFRKQMGWFVTITFFLYLGMMAFFFYLPNPGTNPVLSFIIKNQSTLFIGWIFYFILGAYAGSNLTALRNFTQKWCLWLGLGAGTSLAYMILEFRNYVVVRQANIAFAATTLRPSGLFYTLFFTLFLLGGAGKLARRQSRLLPLTNSIGEYSFGIYLAHPLVLTGLEVINSHLGWGYPLRIVMLNYLICAAGAYVIAYLIKKLPGGAYIVGKG